MLGASWHTMMNQILIVYHLVTLQCLWGQMCLLMTNLLLGSNINIRENRVLHLVQLSMSNDNLNSSLKILKLKSFLLLPFFPFSSCQIDAMFRFLSKPPQGKLEQCPLANPFQSVILLEMKKLVLASFCRKVFLHICP